MNQDENTSYSAMLGDLNALLSQLERDTVGVDELSTRLEKAYHLLEALKKRLCSTEAQIERVIQARNSNVAENHATQSEED